MAGTAIRDRTAESAFLARHWRGPIPPQGPAPARYSALEKSLAPGSCGACHPTQLGDWSTSLHARSMGPGVVILGSRSAPAGDVRGPAASRAR